MPGDPKRCREHAKRCWALASEVTNPVLKESLLDAAQRWAVRPFTRSSNPWKNSRRKLDKLRALILAPINRAPYAPGESLA